jgi:hypothetical protein
MSMIPKSGHRFPAFAKPAPAFPKLAPAFAKLASAGEARSAGEGRPEKIMLKLSLLM